MPQTRLKVIEMAHRRLGLLSVDETVTADQDAFAGMTLDALFEELKTVREMAFTWSLGEVPDAAFLPLSYLLATEIAPHYDVASESRARALARLNAYAFPDDRDYRRDTDDDGTVSADEETAGLKVAYF